MQIILTYNAVKFVPKKGNGGVEILGEFSSSLSGKFSSPASFPNGYNLEEYEPTAE